MLSNNERNVNYRSTATIGVINLVFCHTQNETDCHRPLFNMSYGLTSDSGKSWVVEQLDSIATRYLNQTARVVAKHVRQNISHSQSLECDTSTKPPLLVSNVHDTSVVPNTEDWSSSSNGLSYQTFMTAGEMELSTNGAASMSDSGVRPADDVFQSDL
jgi:hypothetical protein